MQVKWKAFEETSVMASLQNHAKEKETANQKVFPTRQRPTIHESVHVYLHPLYLCLLHHPH
jgi:hypothetical protein